MQKTRLDSFLVVQHPHYSRTQIKKLIDEGFVLVDGHPKKPSTILRGGEKIEMLRRAPEIPKAIPEEIPLDILYEDEDLLVINKAVGMVVHPAPGHYTGTLVSAILHHVEAMRAGEDGIRPGIVHRLDKGTSGVMVVAKNDVTLRALALQFKNHQVTKIYQAIVFGKMMPRTGTIIQAIGRDSIHRRKFSSKTRRAREAITHYKVLKEISCLSFVELKLETGRTHQIRVHLSEKHHPIVGDTLYGAKSFVSMIKDEDLLKKVESIDRPLLHALELHLTHPTTQERMKFTAPLPEDFRGILGDL